MTTDTKNPYGLGRRKSAVARVRLITEAENKTVNGLAMTEYFPTIAMQNSLLAPLALTSSIDTFGLQVMVKGGGKRAQAEAIQLGIARALVDHNDAWRKQLKEAGMLTRDARVKERKKYGLKGARRAPQFSKR